MIRKYQNGLSLVEALVAIVILVIGVLGPISVATRGISDGLYAQNQVVANYLAYEGLDLTINKINKNMDAVPLDVTYVPFWLEDLPPCRDNNPICGVDPLNETADLADAFVDCDEAPYLCQIAYNLDSGFYTPYDPNGNFFGPVFIRQIGIYLDPFTVFPDGEERQATVTVTVTWFNKNNQKSISLISYVYDRRDRDALSEYP